jgi:hypothetical protein
LVKRGLQLGRKGGGLLASAIEEHNNRQRFKHASRSGDALNRCAPVAAAAIIRSMNAETTHQPDLHVTQSVNGVKGRSEMLAKSPAKSLLQ